MTTMLQRIRERAKFDFVASANGFIDTGRTRGEYIYQRGRREENARLLPLIEALIQAVEVSDKALKCYEPTTVTQAKVDGEIYDNLHLGKLAQEARASMQSILEKAVK